MTAEEVVSVRQHLEALLREHDRRVEQRFVDYEKAVAAALTAAQRASEKTDAEQSHRNAQQNEWRGSLSDLSGRMWLAKDGVAALDALRRELTISMEALDDKVTILNEQASNLRGRFAMVSIGISGAWAVAVVAITIGMRFIK